MAVARGVAPGAPRVADDRRYHGPRQALGFLSWTGRASGAGSCATIAGCLAEIRYALDADNFDRTRGEPILSYREACPVPGCVGGEVVTRAARLATRSEARALWQDPLHEGWIVAE